MRVLLKLFVKITEKERRKGRKKDNVIPYNFSIEEKLYRKFAVRAKQLSRLVE